MRGKLIISCKRQRNERLHRKIFVVKETRHQEQRVALIPDDVQSLVRAGHDVFVEPHAGLVAGYTHADYEQCGASVMDNDFTNIMKNIDIIVRVKRPSREREKIESQHIKPGTKMIGSLDINGKNAEHIREYQARAIDFYSFDQYRYPPNTPMDALNKMSVFAGQLAVADALARIKHVIHKTVVIGFGHSGTAALQAFRQHGLPCTVITSTQQKSNSIQAAGGEVMFVARQLPLTIRQQKIKQCIENADIVIATAGSNGEIAPCLIPHDTLMAMKPHSVIIDLAVTEGGNVEGSQADTICTLGNQIKVINVSGYPKAMPRAASILWSQASLYFLKLLIDRYDYLKSIKR